MAFTGLAKVSESGICFQEFPDFPAFIRIDEFNRQADDVAVFHDNADEPLVFGYGADLVDAEVFFKDFGVPADGEYALVCCETVDKCSEVKGKQEYCGQDEYDDQNPEYGAFRVMDEELEAYGEEKQSSYKAEKEFLCLVSDDKVVHRLV